MRAITQEELSQILTDHVLWLKDNSIGERANLTDANLTDANLTNANLADANLTDANLPGANPRGAFLTDANLTGVDLSNTKLSGANLSYTNLLGAKFGLNIIDAASIYYATFSQDALMWLILRKDWAEVRDTLKIVNN